MINSQDVHFGITRQCAQVGLKNMNIFNKKNHLGRSARSRKTFLEKDLHHTCRTDLPGPTTSVGTRTDYSVGPWDYPACATRHLKAWSTRTAQE
jgi:hypothetical protein